MKTGILCACAPEFEPYEKLINSEKKPHCEGYVIEGKLCGQDVVIYLCGLGKVNAAMGAAILIRDFAADRIILSGVAGAIARGLKIGDSVIITDTRYHDLEDGLFTAFHPTPLDPVVKCDEKIIELAKNISGVYFGRTVTGDVFIVDEGRAEIIQKHDPMTCDMETAGAAFAAKRFGVPFNAVRAISDTEDDSGQGTFEKNVAFAGIKACEVVCEILKMM